MAIDYNSIAFKNRDIDKFSKKFGNGDPVKGVGPQNTAYSGPDYTKGRQSNFAGYDRKRESVSQQGFDSGMKKSDQADEKALMNDLNTWSRGKAKEMNKEDRVKSRESKQYERRTTTKGLDKVNNFVDKTLGRGKYDRGSMKKNMDMGGNRSKLIVDKQGQKKQDADCKAKRGSGKTCKPKDIGNSQWTVN